MTGDHTRAALAGRRRWLWAPWLALASLALSGCGLPRRPPDEQRLGGRASVSVGAVGSRPAHRESFEFEWLGTAESGQLTLLGPLGQIVAQLSWTPQRAQLRQAGQSTDRLAATPEVLSESVLGERLPVKALGDWLRGRPWGSAPAIATPEGFAQLGWQVDVRRLASDRQGLAHRPGDAQQASATLRWVLDEALPLPPFNAPAFR